MAYTVSIEPLAQRDIRVECRYLRGLSAAAESRWLGRLNRAIDQLTRDPNRYPEAAEAAELGFALRELVIGRRKRSVYRFLFVIEGDVVRVLRVRHASQDRVTPDDL